MSDEPVAGPSHGRGRRGPPRFLRPGYNGAARRKHVCQQPRRCTDMVFQWDNSTLQCQSFRVEMATSSQRFREIGTINNPVFVVSDPPMGIYICLRIRPDLYFNEDDENDADNISVISNALHNSMEDYAEKYFTSRGSYYRLTVQQWLPIVFRTVNDEIRERQQIVGFAVLSYIMANEGIGTGLFSEVTLIRDADNKYYVAKQVKLDSVESRNKALQEYEILRQLNHPKLIGLQDFYYENHCCVFVTTYMQGGSLFAAMIHNDFIREQDIPRVLRQILEGLIYLHGQNIAHLDLKPDNIVFKYVNDYNLKIIDFSKAKHLNDNEEYVAKISTKDFASPEVIKRDRVSLNTDMWSVGVITYMLLSGAKPFIGDWPTQSARTITANYMYPDEIFGIISREAKDFINSLLKVSAEDRLCASDALAHPWISVGPPKGHRSVYLTTAQINLRCYLIHCRRQSPLDLLLIVPDEEPAQVASPVWNFWKNMRKSIFGSCVRRRNGSQRVATSQVVKLLAGCGEEGTRTPQPSQVESHLPAVSLLTN